MHEQCPELHKMPALPHFDDHQARIKKYILPTKSYKVSEWRRTSPEAERWRQEGRYSHSDSLLPMLTLRQSSNPNKKTTNANAQGGPDFSSLFNGVVPWSSLLPI
jgi:hypothetical protein